MLHIDFLFLYYELLMSLFLFDLNHDNDYIQLELIEVIESGVSFMILYLGLLVKVVGVDSLSADLGLVSISECFGDEIAIFECCTAVIFILVFISLFSIICHSHLFSN